MIKHLWFDVAGTLYRESATLSAAHDKLVHKTYARVAGKTDAADIKHQYDALYAQHHSHSAVFRALGLPSDFWQQALEELDFTAFLEPDLVVTNTLAALQKRLPLSLFTNYKRSKVLEILQHLQIPSAYFSHLLTGDDVSERKPNPAGFRKMIELSGVSADQILYIGDRVEVDIKPAKRLGIQTCLVYGHSKEATYSVARFSELLDLAVE